MADSQADLDAVKPPIIMKVDAPADGEENQDNDINETKEVTKNCSSDSNNSDESYTRSSSSTNCNSPKSKPICAPSKFSQKSPGPENAAPNSQEKPSQSTSYFTQVCPATSTNSMLNNPPQMCSPFQPHAPPKLEGNPFALKAPKSTILQVSSSQPKVPFSLKPSNFNPFKKSSMAEEQQSTVKSSSFNPFKKSTEEESNGTSTDQEKAVTSTTFTNGDSLKFVPLVHNSKKPQENAVTPASNCVAPPPIQSSSSSSFVFGQNLHDRAIADKADDAKPSTSCVDSNGSTDMLFSNAIREVKPEEPQVKETKSLSESAREYEESRANKRKYEEVEVKTGEEGETNILQLSCKLFSYDNGNWAERGRGTLRLNDLQVTENGGQFTQSRLVVRTAGSLRVVINTKVWDGMLVEQASAKSIRMTVMDSSGSVKLFLIMTNPEDSKTLYKRLAERIKNDGERMMYKRQHLEPEKESIVNDTGGN